MTLILFSLVNTTSTTAQYFTPGGDPPGNIWFIFIFYNYNFFSFLVYFEYITKLEDCAGTGKELLALLAFNTLLVLASLLVSCTIAFKGKRLQKRSAQYDVRIDPQETVPQDIDPQETVSEVYFYFRL